MFLGVAGVVLLGIGLKIIPISPRPSVPANLAVNVSGWSSPETVGSGEGTAIHVSAMTEQSTSVPGANVYIRDAGNGTFLLSGTNTVEGMTDDRGQFYAMWTPPRTPQDRDTVLYEMQAKVIKDGKTLGIIPISVRVHR